MTTAMTVRLLLTTQTAASDPTQRHPAFGWGVFHSLTRTEMTKLFKILVCGLPGSGKTTLSKELHSLLPGSTHLNADAVRSSAGDWDFSPEGRLRQAKRMRTLAEDNGGIVIADFVAPTKELRDEYKPDMTIWMNTIKEGRFEDTNKMFEVPANPQAEVNQWHETNAAVLVSHINQIRPQGIMIGRYQPFHGGHKELFRQVLGREGFVTIMVRNMVSSSSNPYSAQECVDKIAASLIQYNGKFNVLIVPNITGVYYGRDVGYNVEKIELGEEFTSISATNIRKGLGITS